MFARLLAAVKAPPPPQPTPEAREGRYFVEARSSLEFDQPPEYEALKAILERHQRTSFLYENRQPVPASDFTQTSAINVHERASIPWRGSASYYVLHICYNR